MYHTISRSLRERLHTAEKRSAADPAFHSIANNLSDDPTVRRNQVRNLCAEGGKSLNRSFENERQQLTQDPAQKNL